MESQIKVKTGRMVNNMVVFLIVTFLLLFVASRGFSQETKANSAMQSVFNELKASEDSPIGTFLMIAGIIVLVGFAMYMSFKGGSSTKPKASKG